MDKRETVIKIIKDNYKDLIGVKTPIEKAESILDMLAEHDVRYKLNLLSRLDNSHKMLFFIASDDDDIDDDIYDGFSLVGGIHYRTNSPNSDVSEITITQVFTV